MQVYFNSRIFSFAFKFETIKKQRGPDASARSARLPDGPFALAGCAGPLEMPLDIA
jgi:hypothetical protein